MNCTILGWWFLIFFFTCSNCCGLFAVRSWGWTSTSPWRRSRNRSRRRLTRTSRRTESFLFRYGEGVAFQLHYYPINGVQFNFMTSLLFIDAQTALLHFFVNYSVTVIISQSSFSLTRLNEFVLFRRPLSGLWRWGKSWNISSFWLKFSTSCHHDSNPESPSLR